MLVDSSLTLIDCNELTKNLKDDLRDTQTSGTPSAPTHKTCPLPKKWKGKDPSFVWDHFKKVEGCPKDKPKAKCNCCRKLYACHSKRNKTSTVQNHLPACPKIPHICGLLERHKKY